jgi:arylsulfatase
MIDFVPTVFDILDMEKPSTWDGEPIPPAPGKSLLPAFQRDVTIERETLWWLHEGNRAVRAGDWKLVAAAGQPWELYDLRTDRAESRDLVGEQPAKATELESLWDRHVEQFTRLAEKTSSQQPAKKRDKKKKEKN